MNISLRDIGLNEYETRVYLTLSMIGKSGTTKISRESDVPFGRIYDVLNSLIKKGLVRMSPERPKRYYAADITAIQEMINLKIESLKNLENELKEIRKKKKVPEDVVYVTKGKKAFHKLVMEIGPEKYDYSLKYNFLYHPMWVRKIKNDKKKEVEIKTMGPMNDNTKENIKKWSKIVEIKEFPNEGVAIAIDDDEYTLIGLINADTTIMIKDKAFTKVMAELFRRAWKVSKKIKI